MELVKIIVHEDGLRLVRQRAAGNFDLALAVFAPANSGSFTRYLPATEDSMLIDGLPPGAAVRVEVKARRLVRRLRHPGEKVTVELKPTPFRILIMGSGRCGTTTLASWLDGMSFTDGTPVRARHESLAEVVLPLLRARDFGELARVFRGQAHNVEAGAFYALAADAVAAGQVVHLVRDGRRVVQSGLNRGWYANDAAWNSVKPDFPGDVFEKCCRLWVHTCAESDRVADRVVRLEDLTADADARARFLADLGLVGDGDEFPHANRGGAPSGFDGWSPTQRERFEAICSGTMDRHYPDWRSTW